VPDKSPDRPQRQEGQERQPADQQHNPELAHGGLPQRNGRPCERRPFGGVPGSVQPLQPANPGVQAWFRAPSGFAFSSEARGQVRNVRLQAGLRESQSRISRGCVEEHAQHLPAALIRHLYAPSPPVRAVGNEGHRLFDDPDGVAMGSQPVRKLDPFAIAYLFVVVRQKIEIEPHW